MKAVKEASGDGSHPDFFLLVTAIKYKPLMSADKPLTDRYEYVWQRDD